MIKTSTEWLSTCLHHSFESFVQMQTRIKRIAVVVQLSATPEPPSVVTRSVLTGPDRFHNELPKPGPTIEDGAWPSYPPYKPVNTTQRVNEILRGFQEASAVHAANGACAGLSAS